MNGQDTITDLFPPMECGMISEEMDGAGHRPLTPEMMQGELRIRDVDLAERLGFRQPRNIRNLIARHREALSQMGAILEVDEIVGKGQRVVAYFLNRKQAIFITTKSETDKATDTTIEIIERFDALDRGLIRPQTEMSILTTEARRVHGGITKSVVRSEIRPLLQAREIDHANIVELTRRVEIIQGEIAAIKAAPVTAPEGDYWLMTKILKAQGISQKGRGRLVHQCTASLKKWCIQTERPWGVKFITCEDGERRYVFAVSLVENWWLCWGMDIVEAHKAARP